jgi:acyl-CoA dehydrogenase
MDFRYTTEQELFRQSVREWAVKNLEPRARQIDKEEDGIPDDITQGIADLGIFGITIPEEYGGCAVPGEELIYAMIAVHEIARADLHVDAGVPSSRGVDYIVNLYGTQQLKEEVLPPRRRARLRRHQHDRARRRLRPRRDQDHRAVERGEAGLRHERREGLRQRPQGVREVGRPERPLHARQDRPEPGPQGHDLHLGPRPPARHQLHDLQGHGPHGPVTGGWIYKDVELPKKYVLGEEGKGFYVVMDGFNAARVLVAAACLGGAEKALEISGEYTAQRTTFGKPLGKNEGISFEMADDWMQLDMLKLNLLRGAWMIGQERTDPGQFSRKDINKVISTCKCLSPTLCHDIARHGMMYHGAFGYTKETPLEMLLRRHELRGRRRGRPHDHARHHRPRRVGETHNPFKD